MSTKNWSYDMRGTITDLDENRTIVFDPTICSGLHLQLMPVEMKTAERWDLKLPKDTDDPRIVELKDLDGTWIEYYLDIEYQPEWQELSDLLADADKGAAEMYAFIQKLRGML